MSRIIDYEKAIRDHIQFWEGIEYTEDEWQEYLRENRDMYAMLYSLCSYIEKEATKHGHTTDGKVK